MSCQLLDYVALHLYVQQRKWYSFQCFFLHRHQTCEVKWWKHQRLACLWSHRAMLLLCVDNFSNQVDEEACRVNWEHTGVATSVKLSLRCIKLQRACLSVCVQRLWWTGRFWCDKSINVKQMCLCVAITGSENMSKSKRQLLSSFKHFFKSY